MDLTTENDQYVSTGSVTGCDSTLNYEIKGYSFEDFMVVLAIQTPEYA